MTTIIIGIIAGILTSVSMLPQLIKVIREKDVNNLSPIMISVLLAGVLLWTIFGILKEEWSIMLSNGFAVIVNSTFLAYYLAYRKT